MSSIETPDWVQALRSQLPAARAAAYLNTGTAGPLPVSTADAIQAEARLELREGRGNFARFGRFIATRERARSLVAELLGAHPDEVALTHHTSDGINIVLWGIDWRPGDVLVTTNLEHDAVVVPVALLRDRRGVEIRFADIGHGERAAEGLAEQLHGRVRLVVLSHIVWSSGARLPLAELTRLVHDAGATVLVDGAQSGGVLPLDVRASNVDYYTLSGQKWICGPEGTGALYVRRDRIESLLPTFGSYFTAARHDFRDHVELHESAKRYELGMVYRPGLAGFAASLEWIQRAVGIDRAWLRSLEMAATCRAALAGLDGVRDVTPPGLQSPLVAVDVEGWSPAHIHALADHLSDNGVIVRSIDTPPYALRASLGFFNTLDDVQRLHDGLAEALERGPDALEIQGWAARLPRTR